MFQRRTRRTLALFALALALFAALPCAMLAGEKSCCGAATKCADASESPCADLAATPCCEARRAPFEKAFAPQVPAPTSFETQAIQREPAVLLIAAGPTRRLTPASLSDHATIRDVLLRL